MDKINDKLYHPLEPDKTKPLYKQLKEYIKGLIFSGEIKKGDKIPTEVELSSIFKVSRITVRKAVSELVDEGYLTKKQGIGTFVNEYKFVRNIIKILSFSISCEINGLNPSAKLIQKKWIKASKDDVKKLLVDKNSEVLLIERLRYANNEPLIIEKSFFSSKYSFLMDEDTGNQSMYELLQNKYNIVFSSDEKSIEITYASPKEASILKVALGVPLYLMRGVVFDKNHVPIHRSEQLMVGDKFRFVIK